MRGARLPPVLLHLAVFVLFSAVAAVATWPVLRDAGTVLPGEKALVNFYLYRTLLDRPLGAWFDPSFPQLDFPDGGTAVVVALPQFFVARLLTGLLSAPAAFNLSLVLHLAFGGYGGWRLSRAVGGALPGGEWPHLVGGAVLGVSSFALGVYANGQPENLGVGYLALAAEAAWGLARGGGLAVAAGMVVAVGVAFLSSPYLVMGFLLAGAPLAFARPARRPLVLVGVVGVLAVVGAGYAHFSRTMPDAGPRVLCPVMLDVEPPVETRVPLGDLRALLRPPAHTMETMVLDPAWALVPPDLTRARPHERPVGFLGWVAVGLAALGLLRAGPGRRWLVLSALGPLVLALGPTVTVNGWVPTVDGAPLRLPLHYLYGLPGIGHVFTTINAPVRLVVGLLLPLSVAAAHGASALSRLGPLPLVLALAEQLVVGPDGPPQHPWALRSYGVYTTLGTLPDRDGVFDTPPVGTPEDTPIPDSAIGTVVIGGPDRPSPVAFTRALVQDAWRHHHPTPYAGCYPPLYNTRLERSAFAATVLEVGRGQAGPRELVSAAAELRALGFGWWVIHTGTGLQDPATDRTLVAAARAAFREVAAAPDGTYLFALPP